MSKECIFARMGLLMIRRLIRRSGLMVKLALAGDDLLYGRRPKPAPHRADIKKLPSTK